jgi:hypothetical protein
MTAKFDVFLSHCVRDARAIEGVKTLLSRTGLSVYVDWIDDPCSIARLSHWKRRLLFVLEWGIASP